MKWIKSSRCGHNANCPEVAISGDAVMIRDSKLGEASPVLCVPVADWQAFVEAIAYRSRGDVGPVTLTREVDRRRADVWVMRREGSPELRFTDSEVAAFVAGVKDGEFDLSVLAALPVGDGSDGDGRPCAHSAPLAAS